jgi:hypothetical protein
VNLLLASRRTPDVRGLAVAVAVALLTTACLGDGSTTDHAGKSCSERTAPHPTLVDFVNRVHWQGRDYLAATGAKASGVEFAGQVGVVRCRVADSLTPLPYTFRDGDAALLPTGTRLYAVRGFAVGDAIGAQSDGRRWLFEASKPVRG